MRDIKGKFVKNEKVLEKICIVCGEKYKKFVKIDFKQWRRSRFCSLKCSYKWHKGENANNWQGGRKKGKHGYILIYSFNHPFKNIRGYVPEHRLVMEKKLGRYLTRKEIVHHVNEIVDDNRIENLKLFANRGEHISYHLIKYWKKRKNKRHRLA